MISGNFVAVLTLMFSPAYLWLGSRYPEGSKRDKKKGVESRILFPNFFVVGGPGHSQRFISATWRTKPTRKDTTHY